MSVRLLSKLCGGDEEFWREVEAVGWLVIDAENGTVAIPGWDRRFSKAAKSRALATVRHQVDKAGGATRHGRGRDAPPRGAQRARDRGDRTSSSSPGDASPEDAGAAPDAPGDWEALRKAWAAGTGRPWRLPDPPGKAADRLDEPGWFAKALAAIEALPRCRYFRDPVTLPQLVAPGFVDKVLGGQFDNAREQRPAGPRGPDDRRPASEAAAEWQRAATDPDTARRREEYLKAKSAKAAAEAELASRSSAVQDDELEAARSAVLAKIRESA
jgi:hypothetical protein